MQFVYVYILFSTAFLSAVQFKIKLILIFFPRRSFSSTIFLLTSRFPEFPILKFDEFEFSNGVEKLGHSVI